MGLIKSFIGAVGGTFADQWLEFFTMDSLPTNVLVTKGQKKINGRSSNTKGSDNIISNGSGVIVADGQAAALVSNGIVVDFAADPGMYTFDASATPSIFAESGGFWTNLLESFLDGVERFKRGGGVYQDQRVYYFNTKEILGNKYGTAEPIAYRVVDLDIGLDMDVDLRCNGEFSYRLTNPILFYSNVAGNVPGDYTRDMIDSQLKAELLTGLNSALSRISAKGIRYSALPGHAPQIADEINDILSSKWRNLRGLSVVSFAVNSVSISDEDEKRIKDLQAMKSLRDPSMAGAALVAAQADAMRAAAENEGGAAIGFLGLGLASQAGGTAGPAAQMIDQGIQGSGPDRPLNYPTAADGGFAGIANPAAPAAAPMAPPIPGTEVTGVVGAAAAGAVGTPPVAAAAAIATPVAGVAAIAAPVVAAPPTWDCPNCGQTGNVGNFCANCGTPKPAPATWDCPNCGQTGNTGNFCANCGTPKP